MQADEAALRKQAAEIIASAPEQPEMVSIGSLLAEAITQLGVRTMTCEHHGEYQSKGTLFGRHRKLEKWTGCPGCSRAIEESAKQAERAIEAEARKAALEAMLKRTALPERFIGRTFDNYVAETPEQRKAVEIVRAYAENFERHGRHGTTLILSGNPGTGKSHLAGAVIQAIMPRRVGLYVTTMGLIRMVRETWRKDAERSEGQVLDELAAVDLLVVDEVGVQYGTDAEKTLLFEILDRRYTDCKPSILLTNLGLDRFREFIGERLTDRLREVGKWVPFEWDSYRAQARKGVAP